MAAYLLYHRITAETGVKLAEDLGIHHGLEIAGRPNVLIRWGNGGGVGYTPTKVLNSKAAIENTVNKDYASRVFGENGIRTPVRSEEVPTIGRSAIHTQGQGFWLCWEHGQVTTAKHEGAEYFIKYIPVKQEWRIHVIDGDVAFVQNKYEQDRISTAFMGIQGFRNNWHKRIKAPEAAGINVCLQAVRAVQLLGLNFGGVDVIISLEDNRPYVLEVNSGPSLPNTETRAPYLEYFRRFL